MKFYLGPAALLIHVVVLCTKGCLAWRGNNQVPSSLTLAAGDGKLVSLIGASFDGVVIDSFSLIVLTLSFKNEANESYADVRLALPTDPRAAIFKTVIRRGDQPEILMEMYPREEAEKIFADAKESGIGAYLTARDAHQADVTRIAIGNLPPNEEISVTLHYAADLIFESDNSLRLSLPVGMIHRYGEASITPSYNVVAPITVSMLLNMSAPVQTITSPTSNPFEMTFATIGVGLSSVPHPKARRIVNIASTLLSTSAEYSLLIKFQEALPPTLYVMEEVEEGKPVFALAELSGDKKWAQQHQQQQDREQLFEIFFVVDQSGSMSGKRNELAIETLFSTISALPQGCLFQVVAFGSDYQELFPEIAVFSDESKATALAYSRTLTAQLGGTMILKPFEAIARKYPHSGLPRYVFLFTDGAVLNTDEVISFARTDNRQAGTRYFTFAIGAGASRALCEGIAEASHGVSEMILGNAGGQSMSIDISTKTSRQIKRIMAPTLTNVELSLSSSSTARRVTVAQQAPATFAPLFQDARELVFLELSEASVPTDLTAEITGTVLNKFPISMTISHVRSMPSVLLRVMAVRAFLREIEEQYDHLEATARGQEDTEYKKRQLKDKAISLSIGENVASKFTALVAVEARSETEKENSGNKIVRNLFLSLSRFDTVNVRATDGVGNTAGTTRISSSDGVGLTSGTASIGRSDGVGITSGTTRSSDGVGITSGITTGIGCYSSGPASGITTGIGSSGGGLSSGITTTPGSSGGGLASGITTSPGSSGGGFASGITISPASSGGGFASGITTSPGSSGGGLASGITTSPGSSGGAVGSSTTSLTGGEGNCGRQLPTSPEAGRKAAVFDLLSAQGSNGAWNSFSHNVSWCDPLAAAAATTTEADQVVVSTLVTMKCLETELGAFAYIWTLAVNKAARFIAGVTGWVIVESAEQELGGLQVPDEVRRALLY